MRRNFIVKFELTSQAPNKVIRSKRARVQSTLESLEALLAFRFSFENLTRVLVVIDQGIALENYPDYMEVSIEQFQSVLMDL